MAERLATRKYVDDKVSNSGLEPGMSIGIGYELPSLVSQPIENYYRLTSAADNVSVRCKDYPNFPGPITFSYGKRDTAMNGLVGSNGSKMLKIMKNGDIYSSNDGENFTKIGNGGNSLIDRSSYLTYCGNYWIIKSGYDIKYSQDGINWTSASQLPSWQMSGLCYFNGYYYASFSYGVGIKRTTDFNSWESIPSLPTTSNSGGYTITHCSGVAVDKEKNRLYIIAFYLNEDSERYAELYESTDGVNFIYTNAYNCDYSYNHLQLGVNGFLAVLSHVIIMVTFNDNLYSGKIFSKDFSNYVYCSGSVPTNLGDSYTINLGESIIISTNINGQGIECPAFYLMSETTLPNGFTSFGSMNTYTYYKSVAYLNGILKVSAADDYNNFNRSYQWEASKNLIFVGVNHFIKLN